MSVKDNCFQINTKVVLDDDHKSKIVSHIRSLFRNRKKFKDNAFAKDEKLPFELYFGLAWKTRKAVCMVLTSKKKENLEKIDYILDKLTDNDLEVDEDVQLSKAVLLQTCDFERYKKKKGDKLWDRLEHNGPYFKHIFEPYQPHRAKLIYDDVEYSLNPLEEEIASFYARRIITERKSVKKFLNKKQFNDNFFKDFKTYLTSEHKKIFKDFKKLDFSNIVQKLDELKEEKDEMKKEKTSDEKMEEKINKLEKKLNYSFAYVNGVKKEIKNPNVEIPGLYIGQGNILTNKGRIKGFINPEDVTINVSKGYEPKPPKGHKWGGVIHDNKAAWTAKYKDPITGKDKYILLSESGDLFKFEKARKLNKFIDIVEGKINKLLTSDNQKERQIGTILYLMKNFGIRAGSSETDDGGEDKSEKVVGASTLMVQNVIPDEDDNTKVELKFYGKDSVYFNNILDVDPVVYNNILSFLKKKDDSDLVFDKTDASEVNRYLKGIDRDFTAKVFRTRLASSIMYEGLKEYTDYSKKATDEEKIADFNEVNRLVALKLNHKKGITDAQKEGVKKEEEKIKELKNKIKDEDNKEKKKKLKEKLEEKKLKLKDRKENLGIALETSKKNYIDPRIVKAWALYVDLPVSKIYKTEALKKHFAWAIENDDFDETFDYLDTPLDCIVGSSLIPAETKEIVKHPKEKKVSKKIVEESEEEEEEIVEKPKVIKRSKKISLEEDFDKTFEEMEIEKKNIIPQSLFKIEDDSDKTLEELEEEEKVLRNIRKYCDNPIKNNFIKLPEDLQLEFIRISKILKKRKIGDKDLIEKILKY